MGDERIKAMVAAGTALTADADKLHKLTGSCTGHIQTQAIQVRLIILQRLPPVSACSKQPFMSHGRAFIMPKSWQSLSNAQTESGALIQQSYSCTA